MQTRTHNPQTEASHSRNEIHSLSAIEESSHDGPDIQRTIVALLAQIRETHRIREDIVRAMTALTNRMCAIVRRLVYYEYSPGWVADNAESSNIVSAVLKLYKEAENALLQSDCKSDENFEITVMDRLRLQLERESIKLTLKEQVPYGEENDPKWKNRKRKTVYMNPAFIVKVLSVIRPFQKAHDTFLPSRKYYTRELENLSQELPVFSWVSAVRGFGPLGLAQIVGETGDLWNYETVSKVWKRIGVAVIGGERQRKHKDEAMAKLHGYSPRRRAILWNIGCSLIKLNNGKYREVYERAKAREYDKNPEIRPKHAHNRAQRIMEKELLKDLWIQWRAYSFV